MWSQTPFIAYPLEFRRYVFVSSAADAVSKSTFSAANAVEVFTVTLARDPITGCYYLEARMREAATAFNLTMIIILTFLHLIGTFNYNNGERCKKISDFIFQPVLNRFRKFIYNCTPICLIHNRIVVSTQPHASQIVLVRKDNYDQNIR